jgi:Restriction endonuclease
LTGARAPALKASPADKGRDIVAQYEREDIDGSKHLETWFVDCKHYKKGVPVEKLQGLIAWAHAERPHTALVVCSGFLSNPAKEWLNEYERNNLPPFRIKYWERPTLDRLTSDKGDLLARWLLTGMRSESEILEAEQEFFDRVWYGRHAMSIEDFERIVAGEAPINPYNKRVSSELAKKALEAGRKTAEKYGGPEKLLSESDFNWGMFSGKLSALRWVLGDEWDMLDT